MIKVKTINQLNHAFVIQKETEPHTEHDWSRYVMQQFSNFCNAYAKAYNKRFKRRGALFVDYIKRSQIDSPGYFSNCVHYIHYNAVHHGLCAKIDEWFWTSYHSFLTVKPSKLERDIILQNFHGLQQFITFHNGNPKISGDDLEFF